jgi:hypothetical protein
MLSVLVLMGVLAGTVIGFMYLERYVKAEQRVEGAGGQIQLVNPPEWLNEELKKRVLTAACYQEDLRPDEDVARSVYRNLQGSLSWIDQVQVQARPRGILIRADWRKPLALVKRGLKKCLLDKDLVVLDYIDIGSLPVVEIEGLPLSADMPRTGSRWRRDDLAAAVAILEKLDRMDEVVNPDEPLLFEIKSIDISNFNGREDERLPHIILYAKDRTEIIWGAQLGAWQRYLEATDREKLAKLYGYYEEYGTLLGGVKYINLKDPQGTIPQPAERY